MRKYLKRAPGASRLRNEAVEVTVREMIGRIEREGDEGVRFYARQLDRWDKPGFRVSEEEIRLVARRMPESFWAACTTASGKVSRRRAEELFASS